jgi:hypothetical protein
LAGEEAHLEVIMRLFAAAFLALFVVGACSSAPPTKVATASGAPASSSASAPSTNPHERALQYTRCLRAHGADVPDPGPSGGLTVTGKDKTKLNDAIRACAQYNPKGSGGPVTPAQLAQLRRWAACIRAHGVPTFADPRPDGTTTLEKKDRAAFDTAQQACRSLERSGK